MEDVQQGFRLLHELWEDINLSEVQKVVSARDKGHFERSHNSCRAGLLMMRCNRRLFWDQVKTTPKMRKNLQGLWQVVIFPLNDASKALERLALPSRPPFSFVPNINSYSSQAEMLSFHRAWCRFAFDCCIRCHFSVHNDILSPIQPTCWFFSFC